MEDALIWIPLLPFLGFLLNGIFGTWLVRRGLPGRPRAGSACVSWIGCAAPLGAFAVSAFAFAEMRSAPGQSLIQHCYSWIVAARGADGAPGLDAPFALVFDGLSGIMCLVVTGVGSLIHLYSTGYMKGDPGYPRFFAYLNLFTAFMLVLVLADNLLLLFVGWEGVGLCSYLLIAYWYEDPANCAAGKKAFVYNRIGDFGVLLAMFILLGTFGTLNFRELAAADFGAASGGALLAITLLLFLGCTGKSAQIPLFVWLPDAMAGPTPVSALIHAATMVTSGVYLCCRMQPLFSAVPHAMDAIAGIGACTALLAALIALSQNDIKRVLAYSTVSQLGFMFFAVGVGAFGAAFFHLVTHAFFKALLFLASGSVIHALHHEQDMRRMGGLRRSLPFTHAIFIIGTLAIAGIPPLSGFVSKDEILFAAYEHGHSQGGAMLLFWIIGVVTAGLTAFYMLRLVAMTFWGESRTPQHGAAAEVHEPLGWMPAVLFALAVLSIAGGALGWPAFLGGENWIGSFTGLAPHGAAHDPEAEWFSAGLSVAVALGGLALGVLLCATRGGRSLLANVFGERGAGGYLALASRRKFFIDEIYETLIAQPIAFLAWLLHELVDRVLIDRVLVHGSAGLVQLVGEYFRRMQTGYIPSYLWIFGIGAVFLLGFLLVVSTGAG